ncbi:MAG: hypothetical protein GX811_03400 [Lentisphaerae bacterium]|nr:hypothetical protein [Lentisphaerota bacterium]
MYEVTKKFVYRARLYETGQRLTADEYWRMSRDKVAIRRGVLEMVAFVELPQPDTEDTTIDTVVVEPEIVVEPAKAEAEEPEAEIVEETVVKQEPIVEQKPEKKPEP